MNFMLVRSTATLYTMSFGHTVIEFSARTTNKTCLSLFMLKLLAKNDWLSYSVFVVGRTPPVALCYPQ